MFGQQQTNLKENSSVFRPGHITRLNLTFELSSVGVSLSVSHKSLTSFPPSPRLWKGKDVRLDYWQSRGACHSYLNIRGRFGSARGEPLTPIRITTIQLDSVA